MLPRDAPAPRDAMLLPPTATPDGRQADVRRLGLRRLNTTLMPHVVGSVAALAAVAAGLVQRWEAVTLVAYTAIGLAVFYALIASGLTRRWRDPMLVFPQVLFGIGLVSLSYALIEVSRGVALQWMCLIIVFDMRRLTGRQTIVAACVAMVLPALGLLLSWDGQGRLADQLIFLALGAVLVPMLLLMGSIARRLQGRRARQDAQLGTMLEQLRHLSVRDALSGLHDRRHMQERLDEEHRRHQRTGRPATVAILDIDLFKTVNDRHGHAVGDSVIKAFAALCTAAFGRETDVLARWGGEEFLLLLPETAEPQALARLHHLRGLVHGYDWAVHQPGLQVTFSAGTCELGVGRELPAVLAAADQALYRAKEAGRDRIMATGPCTADAQEAEPVAAEDLRRDLRHAERVLAARCASAPPRTAEAGDPGGPEAPGARPAPRLTRWLLGPDPTLHSILRTCLVGVGNYVISLALVLHGVRAGFVSAELARVYFGFIAIGGVLPYALVRSGWTSRLKDRSLKLPQMWRAGLALAVLYATMPEGRAFAMQMMCAVVVFNIIDSRSDEALRVGGVFVGLLVLAYLYLLATAPPGFAPAREGLGVLVSAFMLSLLTLQSRNFALARERAAAQRHALSAATRQVFELMTHDPLTGIFNRQYLQTLLERECARHEQSGCAFSIALLDLDHFKRINDRHGHQAGDEVLVGFAHAARDFMRETDAVGRWGGEEFLVVLPETETGSNGLCAAERLRAHVHGLRLSASLPDLAVTFSAGVATRRPGESAGHLLERADGALYQAKAAGRNTCVLAPA